MDDKELLQLFRSGKFTIITPDRNVYYIYSGRFIEPETDDEIEPIHIFDNDEDYGYMPNIIGLLSEALGGTSDTN